MFFFFLGGVPFEIKISYRGQASISLKLQHVSSQRITDIYFVICYHSNSKF